MITIADATAAPPNAFSRIMNSTNDTRCVDSAAPSPQIGIAVIDQIITRRRPALSAIRESASAPRYARASHAKTAAIA